MDIDIPKTFEEAVSLLESKSTSFECRFDALRYIQKYSDQLHDKSLNPATKIRLNQLLLRNIVSMVVNEERTPDLRKRQLIRTECFIMLTRILDSKSLFGGIQKSGNEFIEISQSNDPLNTISNSLFPLNKMVQESHSFEPIIQSNIDIEKKNRNDNKSRHKFKFANAVISSSKNAPNLVRKHRTSVLSHKLQKENFVPGVNPYDLFEIDRKLGYQKMRIWFPLPSVPISHQLIPIDTRITESEQIVRDYKQMRALLSFVGDRVVRINANEKVPINPSDYQDAILEAVNLWNPVIGVNLPMWLKTGQKILAPQGIHEALKNEAKGDNSIHLPTSKRIQSIEKQHHTVLLTRSALRRIVREEYKLTERNKLLFKRELETICRSDDISITDIRSTYCNIQRELKDEKNSVLKSLNSITNCLNESIKLHYSQLPSRYILVVEGSKSNAKEIFARALSIMDKNLRKSVLTIAIANWKILLLQEYSNSLAPKYAKIAALHLMRAWLKNRKIKKVKQWFVHFRDIISREIFMERTNAVVPIQCLYRWWRDRRKFLNLHLAAPYNGPLSDIYLGPARLDNVFFIPTIIRSQRRMLWQASILIQTQFRRYVIQKEFLKKLRKVILLQSILRMFPKWKKYLQLKKAATFTAACVRRTLQRSRFLRLKEATLVVQKFVRRYLCILLKHRCFRAVCGDIEQQLTAIIKIQRKWRIFKAQHKVASMKHHSIMREWAALFLQKNWYRVRGSFPTFVLMSCYRVCEQNDRDFNSYCFKKARYYAARTIQRYYLLHYEKRVMGAIIKVQCWFRGCLGYQYTHLLRRKLWASRKLHHWAKGMMKYKHRCARMIQRLWWSNKSGRMLCHLHYKAKVLDMNSIRLQHQRQKRAATKIQALVHGYWCRRWVYYHKAALVIQKPIRFFLARKRWKREVLARATAAVNKIVGNIVGRGLILAVRKTVQHHNTAAINIQKVYRSYVVRVILLKTKQVAKRQGVAILKIQRFWRQSGAFITAVQEVMAMKKMDHNAYRLCKCLHDIFISMHECCLQYFHSFDPRAGLLTSSLLYRLGLIELLPMFPQKIYKYAVDLRVLTLDSMIVLYNKWQSRELEKLKKDNPNALLKHVPVPRSSFQDIINCLKPRIPPKNQKEFDTVNQIMPVQEIMSQLEFEAFVVASHSERFGSAFTSRAENLARCLKERAWTNYNNFKGIGAVLTKSQILRSLVCAKSPGEVKPILDSIVMLEDNTAVNLNERSWDRSRVSNSAHHLQMGIEMAIIVCPEGIIRSELTKIASDVATYKRRFNYIVSKLKTEKLKKYQKGNQHKVAMTNKVAIENKKKLSNKIQIPKKGIDENYEIVHDNSATTILSAQQSVDRNFVGTDEDTELELNISVCKLYFSVLSKYFKLSNAVQSLKNTWHNHSLARSVRKQRIEIFLQHQVEKYMIDRSTNYTYLTWKKLRKQEIMKNRMDAILEGIRQRVENAQWEMSWVPVFGWHSEMDHKGYPIWLSVDWTIPSTYEMPQYTMLHWNAATRIQWKVHPFLAIVRERRRLRDEARQKEIAHQEKLLMDAFNKSQHFVSVSLDVNRLTILNLLNLDFKPTLAHDPEAMLPYRLRFDSSPNFKALDWVLIKADDINYISAIILKMKTNKKRCDVRLISGEILNNIEISNLCRVNFDIGSRIEARFKRGTLFYSGVVTAVLETGDHEKVYNIKYDDGEQEMKVPLSYIRISGCGLANFITERRRLISFHAKREQRLAHYNEIRKARFEVLQDRIKVNYHKYYQYLEAIRYGTKLDSSARQLIGLVEASDKLCMLQKVVDCRVYYTKAAIRYGWTQEKDVEGKQVIYVNYSTNESQKNPPLYTSEEHVCCKKIQAIWKVFQAKSHVLKLLLQDSIESIVKKAINRYQSESFIGYEMEGVTPIQILLRAGYWEVAESMIAFFRSRFSQLQTLTMKTIANLNPEKFSTIGISKHSDVKSLVKFQEWWNKSSEESKQSGLSFLNYYSSVKDTRSIIECIQQSEHLILQRVSKAFRNSASRASSIAKEIATSRFPISKMQLESFLNMYNGKPGVAQDNINEILNKPTTHTYVQEKEAYLILKGATRRLVSQLQNRKMKLLRSHVVDAEKRASALIEEAERQEHTGRRVNTTGLEGRAALILRVEVLEYLLTCEKVSILLQKQFRRFTKRRKYVKLREIRRKCSILIQSSYRRWKARQHATFLKCQQTAEWEQLWDDSRRVMYYFHKVSQYSTYEEPDGLFRPLVRDFRSSMLIQAWPQLDSQNMQLSKSEMETEDILSSCTLCKERKTVRICYNCDGVDEEGKALGKATPYCFPCFSFIHSNDPTRIHHIFRELKEVEVKSLKCCQCSEPASRKCLGILDDDDIDRVLCELQKTMSINWGAVLAAANIGGERKLKLMLEQLTATKDTFLTPTQVHQLRSLLERTRAECDECYCDSCYSVVHSGGKRALHKWLGFSPDCVVCSVCIRSPADKRCVDCSGSSFCKACFQVFHSRGRKRKHTFQVLREDGYSGCVYCNMCHRRIGSIHCVHCTTPFCNSCYECSHEKSCSQSNRFNQHLLPQHNLQSQLMKLSTKSHSSIETRSTANPLCTVCSELADQRCFQCGDYYCSKSWMGNPGCFATLHQKGNRANHTLLSLQDYEIQLTAKINERSQMKKTVDLKSNSSLNFTKFKN